MKYIFTKFIYVFLIVFAMFFGNGFSVAAVDCASYSLANPCNADANCKWNGSSCVATSFTVPTSNSTNRGTGGLVPCINDCNINDLLGDPKDYANKPPLWSSLIQTALGVSGILILMLFVYGGVTMIISQGEKPKIKKAQDIMLNSFIGLLIVFFAYTFVKFVVMAVVGSGWKIFFGG